MITSDRHRSLFEKLNLRQAGNAGQFRLGGVASDEHSARTCWAAAT